VGSNSAAGLDDLSLVSVVCCQVGFCVSGRSLVQRSPIECDVSECDLITSTVRRPRPRVGLLSQGGGKRLAIKNSVVRLVMISMTTRNLELQSRGHIRSDIELSTAIQKLIGSAVTRGSIDHRCVSTRKHESFFAGFHHPTSYILNPVRIKSWRSRHPPVATTSIEPPRGT